MGLLDILNGMQNGPRGQRSPDKDGGMSPITMAILAYLAYRGIKHVGGSQSPQPAPGGSPQLPGGRTVEASTGGGLDDILGGLLGGNRGSAPAGGGLSGGLGDLLGGLLGGGRGAAPSGGGLGGVLGGLLGGGAAGGILSGGLGDLLKQFEQTGHAETAQSWVGRGDNKDISENDLARSIGIDDIDAMARHTGMSRDAFLSALRRELPGAVDELTPEGRLPTKDEASRWV